MSGDSDTVLSDFRAKGVELEMLLADIVWEKGVLVGDSESIELAHSLSLVGIGKFGMLRLKDGFLVGARLEMRTLLDRLWPLRAPGLPLSAEGLPDDADVSQWLAFSVLRKDFSEVSEKHLESTKELLGVFPNAGSLLSSGDPSSETLDRECLTVWILDVGLDPVPRSELLEDMRTMLVLSATFN
ncbi:MAG: hypothetical protein Q9165_007498 [Trypethelium subeluteriae]